MYLGNAAALSLTSRADHSFSATAPARGQIVLIRSEVSAVSPHCDAAPPTMCSHCCSLNPSQSSKSYCAVHGLCSVWSRYLVDNGSNGSGGLNNGGTCHDRNDGLCDKRRQTWRARAASE